MIRFTVYGPFKAKQSTRILTHGKGGKPLPFPKAYRDPEVTRWQDRVRAAAIPMKPDKPLTGALRLNLTFYFSLPAGKVRSNKDLQPVFKSTKPDFDNLSKGVCDALNKLIYNDDGQIAWGEVKKTYTEGTERLEVEITELEK